MTGRGGSNHHHGYHRHHENPRSVAPQTGKQEGPRDKDKKPELVKAKDARARVNRRIASLWNNHVGPLHAKTVIYQSKLAFINRIRELMQSVEEAWKNADAAEELAQQTKKERDLREKTAGRKGRKETEQNSDPVLDRLNEKVWIEMTKSEECEEDVIEQLKMFTMEYRRAYEGFHNKFKSITSITKQDEEKKNQFLDFCQNAGNYVTETEGKNLQDIRATLDIVNKAHGALGDLYAMCDAQEIQAVKKDMEEHKPIRSCLSADEAGYIEKSVFEEAVKKLDELESRAKEIEKKQKQKKSDAKTKLETAMTDMQKLRYPSQKGSKKRR